MLEKYCIELIDSHCLTFIDRFYFNIFRMNCACSKLYFIVFTSGIIGSNKFSQTIKLCLKDIFWIYWCCCWLPTSSAFHQPGLICTVPHFENVKNRNCRVEILYNKIFQKLLFLIMEEKNYNPVIYNWAWFWKPLNHFHAMITTEWCRELCRLTVS